VAHDHAVWAQQNACGCMQNSSECWRACRTAPWPRHGEEGLRRACEQHLRLGDLGAGCEDAFLLHLAVVQPVVAAYLQSGT